MNELKEWTNTDIDLAYLLRAFNAAGINGLTDELNRLKNLELHPSDAIRLIVSEKIK